MKSWILALALACWVGGQAQALADSNDDGAYLDPPYAHLKERHFRKDLNSTHLFANTPRSSNTSDTIEHMTSVKSQGSRGTCSIFSATALLEGLLVIRDREDPRQLDLSEEWLEYLIMRNRTDDGSSTPTNFAALAKYGIPAERTLPYIGETWESLTDGLAQERCGQVPQSVQKSCLLAHRDPRLMTATDEDLLNHTGRYYDPEFQKARAEAKAFGDEKNLSVLKKKPLTTSAQVKAALSAGIPVMSDLDFYYGAWNHREAEEKGITRNTEHWNKGIVGYPEPQSLDMKVSHADPAGHSVVLVGYDDNVTVTTQSKMLDGSTQTFTYKGVYYFKNSWGTGSFGKNFQVGNKNYPGYGMITQKYAEDFGEFFRVDLN